MVPSRVAVLEDNRPLRDELVSFLDEAGFQPEAFSTAASFLAQHEVLSFDFLILDLSLPDSNGVDVARGLSEKGDPIGIIILTAENGLASRIRGLAAGADAYLGKPFEFDDLLAHMGAVQRRISRCEPNGADRWVLDILKLRLLAPLSGEVLELTVSEVCLMRTIVESHPKHVSRPELVRALGEDFRFYDERRLEKLVSRLRQKIKGASGKSPIKTVRGKGYVCAEAIRLVGA